MISVLLAREGFTQPHPAIVRAAGTRHAIVSALVPVAAVLLWGLAAVPSIHPEAMNDLGLISALPVTYFIALGALLVSLSVELHRADHRPWLVGLHLVAVFVILQATVPLAYPEPRYTWTYKHIGVIDNISVYHHLDRGVDIYQNFPGFFSATAVLSRLSTITPLQLARWAPFVFSAMNVMAVRFALNGLTRDRRRLQVALFVYILTDWVGQNYLSPQAFAFPLCIVAIALTMRYLGPRIRSAGGAHRAQAHHRRWIPTSWLASPDRNDDGVDTAADIPYWAAAVLVLAIAAVVVLSHPLTPFMLIASLAGLVVVRRCPAWLPVAVAIMTVIQVALSWHLLSTQFPGLFGSFGDVSQNAAGVGSGIGSTDHAIVVWGTRLLSSLVWFLALAGALLAAVRGDVRRVATPALMFLAPFVLVFGQSYGGEAIYRVYMFTLPWCAYLISELWAAPTGTAPSLKRRRLGVVGLGCVLLPLFILTYFGLDRYAYVRPAAVDAAIWFDSHTAPGSVLVGVTSNYPAQIGANYPVHEQVPCCYGISLDENAFVDLESPDNTRVGGLVRSLQSFNVPAVYLEITPEEDAYAAILGEAPPGAVMRLGARLARSPAFRVVFDRDGVTLLRLRPSSGASAIPQ